MKGIRRYAASDAIVFSKTKEEFGGLSNMAPGYSLNVNDIIISSAEHLYQACRFPHYPEIQQDIINERSPMNAKWIGRKYIDLARADWSQVCFKVMYWCLEIKLSQNWVTFGSLLGATENKHIIELTKTPKIWGAVKEGDEYVGINALGRLLMHIREKHVKTGDHKFCVEPPNIPNFSLYGHLIDTVCTEQHLEEVRWMLASPSC